MSTFHKPYTTDCFPSHVVTRPQDVKILGLHPGRMRSTWKAIVESFNVMAFIAMIQNAKMYYEAVGIVRDKQTVHNFGTDGIDSFDKRIESAPRNMSWGAVSRRMLQPTAKRKNLDRRQSYCYARHTYLVKHMFTLGQRTVRPGTIHLYQTSNVPLLFYHRPANVKPTVEMTERQFRHEAQYDHNVYVLKPNRCYRVEPGTTYVVIAMQKTLFSLQIVEETVEIPLECRSPFQKRVLQRDDAISDDEVYGAPQPTPFLEHVLGSPPPPSPLSPPSQPIRKSRPMFQKPRPLFVEPTAPRPAFKRRSVFKSPASLPRKQKQELPKARCDEKPSPPQESRCEKEPPPKSRCEEEPSSSKSEDEQLFPLAAIEQLNAILQQLETDVQQQPEGTFLDFPLAESITFFQTPIQLELPSPQTLSTEPFPMPDFADALKWDFEYQSTAAVSDDDWNDFLLFLETKLN